jgi:hypothetical protein
LPSLYILNKTFLANDKRAGLQEQIGPDQSECL